MEQRAIYAKAKRLLSTASANARPLKPMMLSSWEELIWRNFIYYAIQFAGEKRLLRIEHDEIFVEIFTPSPLIVTSSK
jgi:hypothetical protein